ncbi:MAG: Lrp/AsnC family transcriptional regulator [Chloroflexota bacterium]|nr:MAG: Lrp/AsnC family transcriptional regulator [Chloroflexota bacterium]HDD62481.1 Lrp/AsnC family transcriptional regulator [Chloroflexota bacterium]
MLFFFLFGMHFPHLLTFRKLSSILKIDLPHRQETTIKRDMSLYKLDDLDWKIIRLLIEDGRLSSADIARFIGDTSARTITNRIDILTREGIINIRSIVNPEKVGYCVLADVFIEVEPGSLQDVTKELQVYPQISYIALAIGDIDILVSIRAKELDELYEFVIGTIGKIPGVRHTKTFPLPAQIKDITSWLPLEVNNDHDK